VALLRRATGALPEDATGSATSVAVRVDAGEFALECLWQGIAIGPIDATVWDRIPCCTAQIHRSN
jgi:hypothetical protein